MKITNIQFRAPKHTPTSIQGIATLTFDNQFALHGVKVIQAKNNNLLIIMPSYYGRTGIKFSTFHPINEEARLEMEKSVLNAYSEWAVDQAEWEDSYN